MGELGEAKPARRTHTGISAIILVILVSLVAHSLTGCTFLGLASVDPPVRPPEPPVEEPEPEEPDVPRTEPVRVQGLIDATGLTGDFVIDLKYATEDNFTGKQIYPEARFILREETYHKLLIAAGEFAEHGYKIKVWDAYRPFSAQQILWDSVSDKTWVADPSKGSNHNRGAAVDITLVDSEGNELPMPSGFDEFSEKAYQEYNGCTAEEASNRALLIRVMNGAGFVGYLYEWWHFNDSDAAQYPVLDIPFSEFTLP